MICAFKQKRYCRILTVDIKKECNENCVFRCTDPVDLKRRYESMIHKDPSWVEREYRQSLLNLLKQAKEEDIEDNKKGYN